MPASTLTSKGQVTVPQAIRKQLGLHPGDRLAFRLRHDGVVEVVPETGDLLALKGALKPDIKGITIEDMKRAIEEGACSE